MGPQKHRTGRGLCLTIVACCFGLLLSTSASAEPFGGTLQQATADLRVKGTDSFIYEISLVAERYGGAGGGGLGGETAVLTVTLTKCEVDVCGDPFGYTKDLEPDAFSVASDGSSASLHSTFAGQPLNVEWLGGGNTFISNADIPNALSVGQGGSSTASVTLMGFGCETVPGSSFNGAMVATDRAATSGEATEPARSPKGLRPVRNKVPRCAL